MTLISQEGVDDLAPPLLFVNSNIGMFQQTYLTIH